MSESLIATFLGILSFMLFVLIVLVAAFSSPAMQTIMRLP